MQLRIAHDIVETVGTLHQLSGVVARRDPDLGRQLRRAASSIGLNAGEGLAAQGGNRTVRLESAMTSGREVIMALRIASAAGRQLGREPRAAKDGEAWSGARSGSSRALSRRDGSSRTAEATWATAASWSPGAPRSARAHAAR